MASSSAWFVCRQTLSDVHIWPRRQIFTASTRQRRGSRSDELRGATAPHTPGGRWGGLLRCRSPRCVAPPALKQLAWARVALKGCGLNALAPPRLRGGSPPDHLKPGIGSLNASYVRLLGDPARQALPGCRPRALIGPYRSHSLRQHNVFSAERASLVVPSSFMSAIRPDECSPPPFADIPWGGWLGKMPAKSITRSCHAFLVARKVKMFGNKCAMFAHDLMLVIIVS